MLLGEKMPDKNAPEYKERYEREVAAGRQFARVTRLDRLAARVQRFAEAHKTVFFMIVFGFAALCFGYNIYGMAKAYNCRQTMTTATEIQDSVMRTRLDNIIKDGKQ